VASAHINLYGKAVRLYLDTGELFHTSFPHSPIAFFTTKRPLTATLVVSMASVSIYPYGYADCIPRAGKNGSLLALFFSGR
jgi:hypothetical protein